MEDLRALAIFAETVDTGSMSAAARRLDMTPSAVSQTIRALEARNNIALLSRSTRKLALTEAGERYYPHCKRVLEAAQAAALSLQQSQEAPTGELRISAPVGFATHIATALAPMLINAPQLRMRLLVDDAMIDLIDSRIDLAIRIGQLPDSNWVARHLGDLEIILCASVEYLARCGTPNMPQELIKHACLGFLRETSEVTSNASGARTAMVPLEFRAADGALQKVSVDLRIISNNQIALQQMCERGLGIARLGHADAMSSLQRGSLVQILESWRLPALPVWAVTQRREVNEAKVRVALDALKKYFSTPTWIYSDGRGTSL